jgi:cobalt-precorrin 5A hydrolase
MCAYYQDGIERIKKGDEALYMDRAITILEAKHLKATRTMRIVYRAREQAITLEVPYETVMEGMVLRARAPKQPKINEMGSEVVEGYACKPVTLDPVRPIMHYRYHLYVCDDERCAAAAGGEDRAARLRALLKALHLNQGEHRIKISRARCFGACRHRQVAQLNANTRKGANPQNNAVWLRRTHRWSEEKWREIFEALQEDRAIETLVDPESVIEMEVF